MNISDTNTTGQTPPARELIQKPPSPSPGLGIAPQPAGAPPLRLAFDVQETADILGISTKSVRRLITRGILRPSRALRHLIIPKKEIERFLEQTTTQ